MLTLSALFMSGDTIGFQTKLKVSHTYLEEKIKENGEFVMHIYLLLTSITVHSLTSWFSFDLPHSFLCAHFQFYL